MPAAIVVHIVGGAIGIAAGFAALYTAKGGSAHRRSGTLYVYAMLVMTASAMLAMATGHAPLAVNVLAALLTSYLVLTGLMAVHPPRAGWRGLHVVAMLVALGVGVAGLGYGVEVLASPRGHKDGIPAFPYLMFGVTGVVGSALDLRLLRAGGLRGAPRLARHLWRMCFALFIAALSFFIGQADELPRALRIWPMLALPPLAVLATMLYWLRRVRARRRAAHPSPSGVVT